jgi:hypothetical protein
VTEVAGAEPAVGRERGTVHVRVGEVRARDVRPAHDDLTDRTGGEHHVVGTEHRHLASDRAADGPGPAHPGWERVGRDLMTRLGHPVRLDHRNSEHALEIVERACGQRRGRRPDEPQARDAR